ncbi:YodC family protein [Flavobacterium collinsii]|uniref:DUF2158 domain-containing protein n=1 Tax=Flavobacterium collinsii TaxID=1114861 RepID=A0A9W4TEY0_9FLAO|nr:DUF2158 domain-containing protein [Flavobacterium collinsii]CAI2765696.1 conserved protein of unknown function [Flavobacterium collinsii]
MEKKFQIGDSVVLKSGGPTMTVTRHIGTTPLSGPSQYTGRVQCSWFIDNKVERDEFPQEALELEE